MKPIRKGDQVQLTIQGIQVVGTVIDSDGHWTTVRVDRLDSEWVVDRPIESLSHAKEGRS